MKTCTEGLLRDSSDASDHLTPPGLVILSSSASDVLNFWFFRIPAIVTRFIKEYIFYSRWIKKELYKLNLPDAQTYNMLWLMANGLWPANSCTFYYVIICIVHVLHTSAFNDVNDFKLQYCEKSERLRDSRLTKWHLCSSLGLGQRLSGCVCIMFRTKKKKKECSRPRNLNVCFKRPQRLGGGVIVNGWNKRPLFDLKREKRRKSKMGTRPVRGERRCGVSPGGNRSPVARDIAQLNNIYNLTYACG